MSAWQECNCYHISKPFLHPSPRCPRAEERNPVRVSSKAWTEVLFSPSPMPNFSRLCSSSGICWMKMYKSQVLRSITKLFLSSLPTKMGSVQGNCSQKELCFFTDRSSRSLKPQSRAAPWWEQVPVSSPGSLCVPQWGLQQHQDIAGWLKVWWVWLGSY